MLLVCFFFQAEDGIRDLVRSRGLGDVYKRQVVGLDTATYAGKVLCDAFPDRFVASPVLPALLEACLLYTSDAADERSSVDLGGRRIIKKKTHTNHLGAKCII